MGHFLDITTIYRLKNDRELNTLTVQIKHYELHQIAIYCRVMVLHYKAFLSFQVPGELANCHQAEVTGESEREVCADVKGLVKALGHSGLCWVVRVQHAGVEINYLRVEEHGCEIYSRTGW